MEAVKGLKARFALTSNSLHNCQFDLEIHVVIVIERS